MDPNIGTNGSLYYARVVSNKNFATDKTIDVILPQKWNWSIDMQHSNASNLAEMTGAPRSISDLLDGCTVKCAVVMPFGSAYNTGMFQLPQVNTVGLVQELNSTRFGSTRYFWLGGIYGTQYLNKHMHMPSDNTDNEIGADDIPISFFNDDNENEDEFSTSDYINQGQFIIKTKSSTLPNLDDKECDLSVLDFKKIPAENTLVLKKSKAAIRHNINNSSGENIGTETIKFTDNLATLYRDFKNDDKTNHQAVIEDNNGITITTTIDEDSTKSTIYLSNDGNITISTTGNVSVKSEGTTSLESTDKTEIVGNEVNLVKQLTDLIDELCQLKTYGSPTTQVISPDTVASLSKIKIQLESGYTT